LTEELQSVLLSVQAMDDRPELQLPHLYNALSLLHVTLGEGSWVGLYCSTGSELLLGPFQGTPACERIAFGKGVVGACFSRGETIAVPDVHQFPGYICCDEAAASEICVPIKSGNKTLAILDIDLPYKYDYTEEISLFEKIANRLASFIE
ncbi:MAG: GAF domain-containing protein, partial [Bacilli bacterium]|nr:GAF domain-containing protein [Bacilli bacterium]